MSMSIRQFAKQLGVSHEAVRKAIRKEIIPPEAMSETKLGTRVMPVIENVELAANCYRLGTRHSKGHQAGRGNNTNPATAKAVFIRETFSAKREQLAYEREAGLVIMRSKVVVAIRNALADLKEIMPRKYHDAIDKSEQAFRDDIDRPDGDGST